MSNLNIKQVIKNLKDNTLNGFYVYSQFGKRIVGTNNFAVNVNAEEMFEVKCSLKIDCENGEFSKIGNKYIKVKSNKTLIVVELFKKSKEKQCRLIQTGLSDCLCNSFVPVYFYNEKMKEFTAIDEKYLKMFVELNCLIQGNDVKDSILVNGDCLLAPIRFDGRSKFLNVPEG